MYRCDLIVTGFWKTDQIVTQMELHFIDQSITYTHALSIHSVTEGLV